MPESMELVDKLKREGDKLTDYFSNLDESRWQHHVYTEGAAWSVRDVLAHLVTSERGLVKLFEEVRRGGAGASIDFSIDRYNAAQHEKTRETPARRLLDQFREARSATLAWTVGLADEELEIVGRHPFLGETSLREMIKMIYLHNQLHLRDIKKSLQ
jgi:uncharacterized protein (TIGR03083 family)